MADAPFSVVWVRTSSSINILQKFMMIKLSQTNEADSKCNGDQLRSIRFVDINFDVFFRKIITYIEPFSIVYRKNLYRSNQQ